MASQLMPICGHLRTIGQERVVHVCIRQRDHQADDGTNHLMIPWVQYVQDRAQRAEANPDLEARPWWVDTLAEAVDEMNRRAFREALSEDPREPGGRPSVPDESDPDHVKSDKWRAIEEYDRRHGGTGQCPETRTEGRDILRCSRQAGHDTSIHPHGPWMKVGEVPAPPAPQIVPTMGGDPDLQPGYVPPGVDPEHVREREEREQREREQRERDESGRYPLGRSQGETWQEVHEEDPDAWKPPDDGERATEPPAGGPPDADLGYRPPSPRTGDGGTLDIKVPGKPAEGSTEIKFQPPARGEGGRPMATVGEVKAVAARMKEEFETLRAQADEARNIVNRLGGEAQHTLADSSTETAQAVIACAHGAETGLDDVIANVGNAIENLERFIATA